MEKVVLQCKVENRKKPGGCFQMPVDLRTRKLAKLAVNYSVFVKPGEKVIISGGSESIPFLVELYKEIILQKAYPIVKVSLPDVADFFYKYATKEQILKFPDEWMETIKKANKYIGIDADTNTRDLTNCDSKKITKEGK